MGELFCRLCGVVVGVGKWLPFNKSNLFAFGSIFGKLLRSKKGA